MVEPKSPKSSRRNALAHLQIPPPTPATRTREGTEARAQGVQKLGILLPENGIHAGLWLDKYIAGLGRDTSNVQSENPEIRQQLVREVARIPVPDSYLSFYRRWKASLPHGMQREATVKGRMAVGLGNEGVLETSIQLHHTYGVPYIPGSALKGLAASYARLIAGDDWKQGKMAYDLVFGKTDEAGYVTFFDALYIPASEREHQPSTSGLEYPLHPDIITVHHPDYYGNKSNAAPADWDSPTPIPFLSVTGTYLIALAAPDLKNGGLWLTSVFEILEEALLSLGIGAKTSSGYGRMEMARVLSAEDETELQKIDEYLEKIKAIPDGQLTGQLRNFYFKWLRVNSQVARRAFAEAIVGKARNAKKESELARQSWYQDLLKYIK